MAEDPAETLKRFRAPVKVAAVNVKVDATWGAKSVHIQEVRVYERKMRK